MKNFLCFIKPIVLSFFLMIVSSLSAQKTNTQIYLCFGQSNMEGQGKIEAKDKVVNNRFLMMQSTNCPNLERKLGEIYPAIPPLSQCYSGLSPSDYFGKTMVQNLPNNTKVLVINVSIGGCDIRLFNKESYKNHVATYNEPWFLDKIKAYGGNPYNRLIELAKKAQKEGEIKGILLHQGETNTGDENWPTYVKSVYNNILSDLALNSNEVPLLVGELVHEEQNGKCASMNEIINTVPKHIPNSYVISSKGCGVLDDNVHFNAEGYRELGKRYALTMLEMLKK